MEVWFARLNRLPVVANLPRSNPSLNASLLGSAADPAGPY